MRIVISSDGDTIESNVDMRFGRCRYFLIVDIEEGEIIDVKSVENEGAAMGHGAGIRAAQQAGNLKPDKIIAGNLGPNAFNVLTQLNIAAYMGRGTVKDSIQKMFEGKLERISQDNNNPGQEVNIEKDDEIVFMPLLNDNGEDSEIAEHFGHAPFFGLYNTKEEKLTVVENRLDHSDSGKSPIDQISEFFNPSTVFAKGIGSRAISLFAEKGICIKTGNYVNVKEVIENLDKLEDLTESCGH
ncbi:MAG: NifB/NifX family molybdenum-iron cluster-binding protein [Nanoarchaeota archaeon]|nr:NifB/NifX family molybdenum-iron cluster-binding protein [Nanoarchaeota archaeon]